MTDFILEKKPGVRQIHTLRIIGKVAAEFNTCLKFLISKGAMNNFEQSLPSDDHHGFRPNRSSINAGFLILLTFECAQMQKSIIGTVQHDMTAHFDRMYPAMTSIYAAKYGVDQNIMLYINKTIERLQTLFSCCVRTQHENWPATMMVVSPPLYYGSQQFTVSPTTPIAIEEGAHLSCRQRFLTPQYCLQIISLLYYSDYFCCWHRRRRQRHRRHRFYTGGHFLPSELLLFLLLASTTTSAAPPALSLRWGKLPAFQIIIILLLASTTTSAAPQASSLRWGHFQPSELLLFCCWHQQGHQRHYRHRHYAGGHFQPAE